MIVASISGKPDRQPVHYHRSVPEQRQRSSIT
jgi:hypothetical protein